MFFFSKGYSYFNVPAVPTDSSDLLQNSGSCWGNVWKGETAIVIKNQAVGLWFMISLSLCIIFNLKNFRKQHRKWAAGLGILTTSFTKHSRKNNSAFLQFLSRNRKTSKHSPTQLEACITLIPKLNNDNMSKI